jgi:drug/metabolite transporter (DMT)-like permease
MFDEFIKDDRSGGGSGLIAFAATWPAVLLGGFVGYLLLQAGIQKLGAVIGAMLSVLTYGLLTSAIWGSSDHITRWLARHTRVTEPDPTLNFRMFEQWASEFINPVARLVTSDSRSRQRELLLFDLAVGMIFTVAAVGLYLASSFTLIGMSAGVLYTAGTFIDPAPVFPHLVAILCLVAISLTTYAQSNAERFLAQD